MANDMQKPDELLSKLTDAQREAARGLKTPEEMLAFAQQEGIELTEEQLSQIAGAGDSWWPTGGYK